MGGFGIQFKEVYLVREVYLVNKSSVVWIGRVTVLFKGCGLKKYVCPPVDQSGSTGWPHTCEYMGSTNWTHGVIKKKKKRREVERKSIGVGWI